MHIYNTLGASKESFKPINAPNVGMYVCGPTVYDFGHLGHGRAAVSFDVIRKYLEYKGYKVKFVMNYTDVDDKMIQRAEMMKISVEELANKILPEYEKDYGALGVKKGDVVPKATQYVEQMIELIKVLEEKGYAYRITDGIYYNISKFSEYGKLSKQNLAELRSGIRVTVNDEKRSPQDFVLWKFSKPGEPVWSSPWGDGRPGWHIECSAMSWKNLGETIDIHGGGADLIFPHHECEIAQSEACFGKKFAKYWLHNGFIRVDNEKMSKSLGNFFTLRDVFKKYKPQAVRFLFLQTHYRSPIDFTHELLEQSEKSLMRIHDFMRRLDSYKSEENIEQPSVMKYLEGIEKRFCTAMDDDFETPQALAACFDLIKDINRDIDTKYLSNGSKDAVIKLIDRLDIVLGIFKESGNVNLSEELLALIKERELARADKEWGKADEIRDKLLKNDVQIEDTSSGTIWKKI